MAMRFARSGANGKGLLDEYQVKAKPRAMTAPLRLFNSLTRELETFHPVPPGEALVYSCGPTVYGP
jgi:hypothetical protein